MSIGRALINHPPVILADEPTGNLDSRNTTEVMNMLIDAVKTRNQTLVLITHEPEIMHIRFTPDWIAILVTGGAIIFMGWLVAVTTKDEI